MAAIVYATANIPWKCFQAKEGNWIGICDSLKLTVQAETRANLMEDIALTLDAVMKDLFPSSELPRFLV